MTSILVARFLMNLREVDTTGNNTTGSLHSPRISGTHFTNSIVGNLGAPLVFEGGEAGNSESEDSEVTKRCDDHIKEYFPILKEKRSTAGNKVPIHLCNDTDCDTFTVTIQPGV